MSIIGWSKIYEHTVTAGECTPNTYGNTGGTITTDGLYTVHKFTTSGTFKCGKSGNVTVLVLAGGAGGNAGQAGVSYGNGGGGGSVEYNASKAVTTGNITVTIGQGSAGTASANTLVAGDSVFGDITAAGAAINYYATKTGGANSHYSGGTHASQPEGGGGAGGGQNGSISQGGNGYISDILVAGNNAYYGGGGGGGGVTGNAGLGGGTEGTIASNSSSAANNTGGGAGGCNTGSTGGNGGSGIVIVRCLTSDFLIATGLTSLTISGLSGDTDLEYKLEARIVNGYNGGVNYFLYPNNDTGSNYGRQYITGVNTTVATARFGGEAFAYITGCAALNQIGMSTITMQAKSGYVRSIINEYLESISTTTITTTALMGIAWNNTVDNITSLVVLADQTGGLGIGSQITLWGRAVLTVTPPAILLEWR